MSMRNDGLWTVQACRSGPEIASDVPLREIVAAIDAGQVVVIKGAFDPAELVPMRSAIQAWEAPDRDHDLAPDAGSTRFRSDNPPGAPFAHALGSFLFAVNNPADKIGQSLRPTFERLARYWRAVTGGAFGFEPDGDGRALRARGLYYPPGGYFDWHHHPREPLGVGVILGLSVFGVEYHAGGTEFRTPFGVVSTEGVHTMGDVCLFRYDLEHRVTPVDPEREPRWDGAGRWVLTLTVQ